MPSPPPSPARLPAPPAPTPGRCSCRCAGAPPCGYRATWSSLGPDAYETYLREHARPDWDTPSQTSRFKATIQRTPDGPFRLSVTLVNETPQPDSDRGFLPEAAIYDASFGVTITGARVVPSEYRVVERDYRTDPLVHAHGRFCCLDEDAFAATGELRTTSLPVHRQMVYESRPELQPSFTELAAHPVPALERIEEHMTAFATAWDSYLATASLTGHRPARLRS